MLKYLLLLLLPLNIFFHFGQLNGTYTIGGLNPNYSTLTSAVNSLISNGIILNRIYNITKIIIFVYEKDTNNINDNF